MNLKVGMASPHSSLRSLNGFERKAPQPTGQNWWQESDYPSEDDEGPKKEAKHHLNRLCEAITLGDSVRAHELVSTTPNLNLLNDGGWTPLHFAARQGDADLARWLLHHRAVHSARKQTGLAAIHVAAEHDFQGAVLKVLLDAGADPNTRDGISNTPLIIAVRRGNIRGIEILLKARCLTNLTNITGETALDVSILRGQVDLVTMILDAGADIRSHTSGRQLPLVTACRSPESEPNKLAIVNLLLQRGADVNGIASLSPGLSQSALHSAIWAHSSAAIIQALCRAGANLEITTSGGRTPLHCASAWNSHETVDCLLQHGANPNHGSENGETPLIAAVKQEHRCKQAVHDINETIRLLIDGGADPNARNNKGRSALHLVLSYGPENAEYITRLLLSSGTRVDKEAFVCLRRSQATRVALETQRSKLRRLLDGSAEKELRDEMAREWPLVLPDDLREIGVSTKRKNKKSSMKKGKKRK